MISNHRNHGVKKKKKKEKLRAILYPPRDPAGGAIVLSDRGCAGSVGSPVHILLTVLFLMSVTVLSTFAYK